MKKFIKEMQKAINYIEEHVEEQLDIQTIAAQVYLSPYYFQRVFHAVCGVTLSEYIRRRRLSLAGEVLQAQGVRVIDVALRFGYDSPDSFARSFQRFHGVAPSQARDCKQLRRFLPIQLRDMEGIQMEYRIVDKPAFTLMGVQRRFHGESSYQDIPAFWKEWLAQGENRSVMGAYGVCLDSDGMEFDYLIADDYVPWSDVPAGCVTHTIPASTWAIFPCRGALPDALQSVNTRIWKEWIPGNEEWCMAGNFNMEVYTPSTDKHDDDYCEIWVPVKKA